MSPAVNNIVRSQTIRLAVNKIKVESNLSSVVIKDLRLEDKIKEKDLYRVNWSSRILGQELS